MRLATWIAALLLVLPALASADPVVRTRRPLRNRFSSTLAVGASVGAGSPLGWAGGFVEVRPWRALAIQAGGGAGGSFGPALAATVFVSPVSTRGWALDLGVSFSHQFSLISGEVIPHRPELPGSTNWISVEVASEFRPSRHFMLRIGVGYGFLLNTGDFRIASSTEIANANLPSLPGVSPVDAVRAAAEDRMLGTWFVHFDVAPYWRF